MIRLDCIDGNTIFVQEKDISLITQEKLSSVRYPDNSPVWTVVFYPKSCYGLDSSFYSYIITTVAPNV
jgi:hypothetical protein